MSPAKHLCVKDVKCCLPLFSWISIDFLLHMCPIIAIVSIVTTHIPQSPSRDSFYRIALKKLASERAVLAPSDPESGGFSPETGWKAASWDGLETLGGSACLSPRR